MFWNYVCMKVIHSVAVIGGVQWYVSCEVLVNANVCVCCLFVDAVVVLLQTSFVYDPVLHDMVNKIYCCVAPL